MVVALAPWGTLLLHGRSVAAAASTTSPFHAPPPDNFPAGVVVTMGLLMAVAVILSAVLLVRMDKHQKLPPSPEPRRPHWEEDNDAPGDRWVAPTWSISPNPWVTKRLSHALGAAWQPLLWRPDAPVPPPPSSLFARRAVENAVLVAVREIPAESLSTVEMLPITGSIATGPVGLAVAGGAVQPVAAELVLPAEGRRPVASGSKLQGARVGAGSNRGRRRVGALTRSRPVQRRNRMDVGTAPNAVPFTIRSAPSPRHNRAVPAAVSVERSIPTPAAGYIGPSAAATAPCDHGGDFLGRCGQCEGARGEHLTRIGPIQR